MYELFSGAARKRAYAAMSVVGVIIGAVQVAYIVVHQQPTWLDIALAVFAFLGGSVHSMSASNTATVPPKSLRPVPPSEPAPAPAVTVTVPPVPAPVVEPVPTAPAAVVAVEPAAAPVADPAAPPA